MQTGVKEREKRERRWRREGKEKARNCIIASQARKLAACLLASKISFCQTQGMIKLQAHLSR